MPVSARVPVQKWTLAKEERSKYKNVVLTYLNQSYSKVLIFVKSIHFRSSAFICNFE